MSTTTTTNYSLLTPIGLWAVNMACHWQAIAISKTSKEVQDFRNTSPRAWRAQLERIEKPGPAVQKVIRAEAANANGFEQFGLLGAAIVAGNMARLPAEVLNKHCGIFLLLRIIYSYTYITNTREIFSPIRSLSFLGACISCFSLLYKAHKAINTTIL